MFRFAVATLTVSGVLAARTRHSELSEESAPHDVKFCEDAECCKQIAKDSDGQLCDDFYNQEEGVGFTMLKPGLWLKESGGWTTFFNHEPMKERSSADQFCVSISHSGKAACPYPGAGGWGVLFGVSKEFDFWQYFQKCKSGELTGQCTDGFKCGFHSRQPMSGWTYEQFKDAKNAIVEQTGTRSCKNHNVKQYNEFDTNGLSANSIAGLFIPECLSSKDKTEEWRVCKAFNLKFKRAEWPVFHYVNEANKGGRSSLRIARYLNCSEFMDVEMHTPEEDTTS